MRDRVLAVDRVVHQVVLAGAVAGELQLAAVGHRRAVVRIGRHRGRREARHGVARRVRRAERERVLVVGADLERVVAEHASRHEVVGVEADLVGRAHVDRLRTVRRRAAVDAAGDDEQRLDVDQRRVVVVEHEVVADVRVLHVHQQPVAHHPLVAGLEGRVRADVPVVAEAGSARHLRLAHRRLGRRDVARVARVALLQREEVEERQLVALEQLDLTLEVGGADGGPVGVQARVDVFDRVRQRVRLDRLALRGRLVEVDDADLHVLLAVAAPHPRAAALDRAAHLGAVVVDVLDRVARGRAEAALVVGDVLRLERIVGVVDAARAVELVAAALGDQVDADAAGLLRHVDAAGVDRHFLERVEVVVGRRRAGGVHVGDVDAVERPLVVERCCRRARCSWTAGPTCCRRCSRGPWRCRRSAAG